MTRQRTDGARSRRVQPWLHPQATRWEQLWRIGTDGPPSDDDAKELRRELASFRQAMLAAPAAREQTLSESDRQKLRALGYLGD